MIAFEMKYENWEFCNLKNVSNINAYLYFEGFGYKNFNFLCKCKLILFVLVFIAFPIHVLELKPKLL